jgi:hypothetical protein
MKKLKSILVASILTVATFSATVFTSCNPDACKDVVCSNGGTCTDGTCACAVGYEGTNCDTESKAKFLKNWTASDLQTGSSVPTPYSCVIATGAGITNVIIASTFADDFFVNNITATVNGNTITIGNQEPDSDGYKVSGSGTYTNGSITWNYSLTNPTNSVLNYTGTWN